MKSRAETIPPGPPSAVTWYEIATLSFSRYEGTRRRKCNESVLDREYFVGIVENLDETKREIGREKDWDQGHDRIGRSGSRSLLGGPCQLDRLALPGPEGHAVRGREDLGLDGAPEAGVWLPGETEGGLADPTEDGDDGAVGRGEAAGGVALEAARDRLRGAREAEVADHLVGA